MTQLQFWTTVGFFTRIVSPHWWDCIFQSLFHHGEQTRIHFLWTCSDSGFVHGNYHSPSVSQISFIDFPKYMLHMIEKFVVCHTISWKLTYKLCFTGTLITKTFWISLWPMQKWHCAASYNTLPPPWFLLALAKHGINSTEVNRNQISTQAIFCPLSQEKQINPGLRLQVFNCSF